MPPTPFVPEVPHAEVELTDVGVAAEGVLPGDGYRDYVERFRTLEDVHVHAAVLAYVLSVARRFRFPPVVPERLAAALVTVRALAALDPDATETHVALAGALGRDATLLEHAEPHRERVDADERDRWRSTGRGTLGVGPAPVLLSAGARVDTASAASGGMAP
jgi:acyl-CoA dehydrogenase